MLPRAIALLLTCLSALGVTILKAAEPASPPNVLFIRCDDLRP